MNVLERLRTRFEEIRSQLQALAERAQNENRGYTEAEAANELALRTELTQVHERIEAQVGLERSIASVQELVGSAPAPVTPTPAVLVRHEPPPDADTLVRSTWPTPGDYMHDIIHAYNGDPASRDRIERAIANELLANVPGLVPTPIVGDLVNIIDSSRPAVSSLRQYGMPTSGASFTRPKVTQHTQVGVQTAEKTELPSRQLVVTPLNVAKATYGGALNVSFQVIDWTSPSALNAISNDLADEYAIQTELVTTTMIHDAAYTTNVGNKVTIATAGAADVIKGLYQAAGKVYSGAGMLPDVIYASADVWAELGAVVDTAGRPIFPAMGPNNSSGSMNATTFAGNPLGLSLVVSPQFASGTLIVAASKYGEVYEDRRGALRVVEPKILGWEIAYYGYFASLITAAAAFVAIAIPALPLSESAPAGEGTGGPAIVSTNQGTTEVVDTTATEPTSSSGF